MRTPGTSSRFQIPLDSVGPFVSFPFCVRCARRRGLTSFVFVCCRVAFSCSGGVIFCFAGGFVFVGDRVVFVFCCRTWEAKRRRTCRSTIYRHRRQVHVRHRACEVICCVFEFCASFLVLFCGVLFAYACLLAKSMMSPITANSDASLANGSACPEARFVLSPPESPRPAELANSNKSQCSSLSDGENYEWTGEGVDIDADSGIASDRNAGDVLRTRSPSSGINRHTWLRTSLRRSPPSHQDNLPNRRWGSFRHSGKRQLGSNALASQLYRSSSFNSSGRSSTCDTADDMYSDASLEEDVHDLHHKFQVLQQQVGVLQDSANQNDERYTRAKADNAALQARVMMLEEQLRDAEMRHEERLQDEQRRSKELVARVEREKQLLLENSSIRLQATEAEAASLKEEVARQRLRIEKIETERRELSDQMQDLRSELISAKEQESSYKEQERRLNQDQLAHNQLIDELSREVERLRSEARTPALPTTSPETLRLEELHEEMSALREKNTQLQDAYEELQATLLHAGVEQGRLLTTAGENSLAAELEAMTHDELDTPQDADTVVKIQQALKEQQEVNAQLRCYIDGILLNIVENHPQLLEVKQRST